MATTDDEPSLLSAVATTDDELSLLSAVATTADAPMPPTLEAERHSPDLNTMSLPVCHTTPCLPLHDSTSQHANVAVPSSGKEAKRKAHYRMKIRLLTPNIRKGSAYTALVSRLVKKAKTTLKKKKTGTSPSPGKLKAALYGKLQKLQKLRSKKALAARKLLLGVVSPNETQSADSSEQRLYCRKQTIASRAAIEFFQEVSIDLPGKKSVSKKTLTQKKILPKRMKRLHKEFQAKNPEHKLSLRGMYRHLPHDVLSSRKQAYRQCLCEVCKNVDLKLDTLNRYLKEPVDGGDALSERSLCNELTLLCLDRKCPNCGADKLQVELAAAIQPQHDTVVKWKTWEMVKSGHGKRVELVSKEDTLQSLLANLMKQLQSYSRHLFVFRWQYRQFKTLLSGIPNMWAVVVCDFAENFLCKYQDEVQSAHWGYSQVTVHPTVLTYSCPHCNDTVTDYLIFLSDDLCHDASMVKTILAQTTEHLQSVMDNLVKMVVFSDGCAAQYKSKLPFYHLSNACDKVAMERCFFGSRHGKSACDACGGVIKSAVDDDIRTGECIVQNAESMYQHCCENFMLPTPNDHPAGCCHTKRSFKLVTTSQIDRSISSSSVMTVPGTRQLHSLKGMGNNTLATRRLACFCHPCLQDKPEECLNKKFVNSWEIVKLKVAVPLQTEELPEDAEDISRVRTEQQPRDVYFEQLQDEMKRCKTYQELEHVVANGQLLMYPLPALQSRTVVDVSGTIDSGALKIKPESAPATLYPVQTGADGNCLPRAVSLLVFGDETHHLEVRCRIVSELVQNFDCYVQGKGMAEHEAGCQKVAALLAVLAEDGGLTVESATTEDIETMLRAEIMQVRWLKSHMGLWQLAACANICETSVQSVYPQKGWEVYRDLNNRLLQPRIQHAQVSCLHIMWTTNRQDLPEAHWTANHFVPLLPITDSTAPVSVVDHDMALANDEMIDEMPDVDMNENDFFMTEWEGTCYVAKVEKIDHSTSTVLLNFMEQRHNMFVWPAREDTSWESMSSLQRKVHLELDEAKSTQRQQFYKLV